MTADLAQLLRERADLRIEDRGRNLLREAADALDAYDGTTLRNNILRKQVEVLDADNVDLRARLAATEKVVRAARTYLDAEDRQANAPDYTNGESLVLANGVFVHALERYEKAYLAEPVITREDVDGLLQATGHDPADLNISEQPKEDE